MSPGASRWCPLLWEPSISTPGRKVFSDSRAAPEDCVFQGPDAGAETLQSLPCIREPVLPRPLGNSDFGAGGAGGGSRGESLRF